MEKPRYVWNHKWKFWAKDGGNTGFKFIRGQRDLADCVDAGFPTYWHYCWIEAGSDKDCLLIKEF